MNVIVTSDGIHPYTMGGMQKHTSMLVKQLLLLGHRVLLATLSEDKTFDKNEVLQSLGLFGEYEKNFTLAIVHFPHKMAFPGHYVYESFLFSKQIYLAIQNQLKHFDFVYCQGFTGWFLLKNKHLHSIRIGVNFHGLNMFQPSFGLRNQLQNIMFRPFVRFNLKAADIVFSLGGRLTGILNSIGIENERIIEQFNGIDESWLKEECQPVQNSAIQFLFVGRKDRVKGLDEIIAVIEKTDVPVQLNVVGQFGISTNKVNYIGVVKDEHLLKETYRQNDVLIMNSYSEGSPTVILEAMACCRPVISSNVGAIESLVDEENGFLFEAGDKQALSDAVLRFAQLKADDRRRMGENSRNKIKAQFVWRHIVESSFRKLDSK